MRSCTPGAYAPRVSGIDLSLLARRTADTDGALLEDRSLSNRDPAILHELGSATTKGCRTLASQRVSKSVLTFFFLPLYLFPFARRAAASSTRRSTNRSPEGLRHFRCRTSRVCQAGSSSNRSRWPRMVGGVEGAFQTAQTTAPRPPHPGLSFRNTNPLSLVGSGVRWHSPRDNRSSNSSK